MFVDTILKAKGNAVVTAHPDTTVTEAAGILTGKKIGLILVTDEDDGIVGILSERDIVHATARHDGSVKGLAIRDIMTKSVLTCSPDDTLGDIMAMMTHRRVRHLPVLDDGGKLAGLISIGDVMKYRLEEIEHEEESMRQYISGVGY